MGGSYTSKLLGCKPEGKSEEVGTARAEETTLVGIAETAAVSAKAETRALTRGVNIVKTMGQVLRDTKRYLV
jgi:hypothetical protein